MSLPLGHGLAGMAIAKKTRISLPLAFVLASVPDLDYFFGLFFANGNMLALHRSPFTHSPVFGIFVALVFWVWGKIRKKSYSARQLIGIYLIITSHWVLDTIVPPLPYLFDIFKGTDGLLDFLSAHIFSFEFFYNILLDLVIYGTLYVITVKLIFKQKRLF